MYNLFVTAEKDAWTKGFYQYDRSRFLEYTPAHIVSRFEELREKHIEALKKLPCLFAYEGEFPMHVGRLTGIKVRGRTLLIEFEVDRSIPAIPYDAIDPIRILLDIRDWEMNRTHWAVKDEKLFDRLRSRNLIPHGTSQPQQPDPLPDRAQSDLEITSVQSFIKEILALEKNERKETFYRGHSRKSKYRLEPSIFRKDEDGNYLHLDEEHRMYRELIVSNSHDFQNDTCSLDKLVRMQHYSLPTRLLDITSNPLVALYFACRSPDAENEPGDVIVFLMESDDIKYFDSDTASCLANLARLPKAEKDSIDFSLSGIAFNKQPTVKRLLHFIKEEKPYFEPRIRKEHLRDVVCVKAKRSNDRISSQLGAFLLFGHDAVLDELGTPRIGVKRIGVTNKKTILKELDRMNINERTIFPYIENSARYIATKFSFRKLVKS